MIITQTPYRISFFGGGTDYPDWYLQHGGQVLSTTIDKYVYISCRYLPPFFEHKLRLVYSVVECCQTADELDHPAARAILNCLGIKSGLEIHYDGDLPARSGMGSSSSFSVGLINTIFALKEQTIDPHKLALEAIRIEQDVIGESVGSQDQVNAAYGGFNRIRFKTDGQIDIIPSSISDKRKRQLSDNLMLFYTGIGRTADTISASYARNTESKSRSLNKLLDIVEKAIEIVEGEESLEQFGYLLHESWIEKKQLSAAVTNSQVDSIYDKALNAGALGGKLCGAGGGGMILFYVAPENQESVRDALSSFLHIPFNFSNQGSKIIFSERQQEYEEDKYVRSNKVLPFVELTEI